MSICQCVCLSVAVSLSGHLSLSLSYVVFDGGGGGGGGGLPAPSFPLPPPPQTPTPNLLSLFMYPLDAEPPSVLLTATYLLRRECLQRPVGEGTLPPLSSCLCSFPSVVPATSIAISEAVGSELVASFHPPSALCSTGEGEEPEPPPPAPTDPRPEQHQEPSGLHTVGTSPSLLPPRTMMHNPEWRQRAFVSPRSLGHTRASAVDAAGADEPRKP